jgi:uncharacterized protein (TIGR00304 family)
MNKYHGLSLLCFISGFILLALSIALGDGKVYWAVIIFVIEGSGVYSFLGILGILLVFLGFIFLLIAFVSSSYELVGLGELGWDDEVEYDSAKRSKKRTKKGDAKTATKQPIKQPQQQPRPRPRTSVKTGGVIFIGPIPIIWGSDRKIAYIMAIVAVVLVISFLIFTLAWLL